MGCLLVAGSVLGGAAPSCCKHLWSWPDPNPCSGQSTVVCESSSTSAGFTDPERRVHHGIRWAQCHTITLKNDAFFLHAGCSDYPQGPGSVTLIARLPDGTCCFIVAANGGPGGPGNSYEVESQPRNPQFKVMDCIGFCGEPVPPT